MTLELRYFYKVAICIFIHTSCYQLKFFCLIAESFLTDVSLSRLNSFRERSNINGLKALLVCSQFIRI